MDVKWTESVHTLCREWVFNVELRSCQISLVDRGEVQPKQDMLLHYFCTFVYFSPDCRRALRSKSIKMLHIGFNVTVMHRVIQLFV